MLILITRTTNSHSLTQKHENKHNNQQICIKMKRKKNNGKKTYIYILN